MNVKEIKTLVGIMEDSSLTALEIEVPDLKLRLERSAGTGSVAEVLQPPVYSVPAAAPAPAPAAVPAASAAPVQPAAAEPQAAARENAFYKEIKGPMVGVFYTSSAPEAEPYVTKGTQVKKGDVVCIIEAMKLMNEIAAEEEGQIVEVCVQNGQIVEYGQTLFKLS